MARNRPSSNFAPKQLKTLSPVEFTRAVAATLANPALQPWMRAYMKDRFEFLGIRTPARRAAIAGLIRAQKDATAANLLRSARALWAMPEREYQYVAVDLLARHANKLKPAHIPALLTLVQKKPWWDSVDALAAVIGRLLLEACAEDAAVQSMMDEALSSRSLWVRRVAIIHQLGWRAQTDSRRLFAYATACAHEKDFFIRKAIGWALRDYARHAPSQVRVFLKANRDTLSPLTQREAGKHIL